MKRIFVLNAKGGTGKTTIANELAFALDDKGIPYSYFDLEKQGGGTHEEHLDPEAVVQIADTPARPTTAELEKWAKAADIAIVPTRTGKTALYSTYETIKTIQQINPNARIFLIINGWNRFRLAREYREWLTDKFPDIQILTLPNYEAIGQAVTRGISVTQHANRSKAANAIREITDTVLEAAGIGDETENG